MTCDDCHYEACAFYRHSFDDKTLCYECFTARYGCTCGVTEQHDHDRYGTVYL